MGQAKGSVNTLGPGLVWPGDKIKRSSCKFNIWQRCLTIRVAIVCCCWLVLLLGAVARALRRLRSKACCWENGSQQELQHATCRRIAA